MKVINLCDDLFCVSFLPAIQGTSTNDGIIPVPTWYSSGSSGGGIDRSPKPPNKTRTKTAKESKAKQGKAKQGKARQGKAKQSKAKQSLSLIHI